MNAPQVALLRFEDQSERRVKVGFTNSFVDLEDINVSEIDVEQIAGKANEEVDRTLVIAGVDGIEDCLEHSLVVFLALDDAFLYEIEYITWVRLEQTEDVLVCLPIQQHVTGKLRQE